MFVWSVKASTLKFVAVIAASALAIGVLAVLMPRHELDAKAASAGNISYKLNGEGDIADFLSQFGYTVSECVDTAEVTIPKSFDPVYESYNDLQKLQGLDLSKYRFKTVKRYTYKVENYEGYNGTVLADVIVYKSKVIGGDICSADVNGFLHGFDKSVVLP